MPALSLSGLIFFAALACAPIAAFAGVAYGYRRGTAYASDVAATVLPMLLFVAIGATREDLKTGLAMIVWPVLVGMLSMYLVAAKLLVAQRFFRSSRVASNIFLVALLFSAGSLAIAVPQLLE